MPFRWDPQKTRDHYRNFSGTDIIPIVYTAGRVVMIGNVRTLSISEHSDFWPVRTFGHRNVREYVPGTRTYAGTIVFVDFDYAALAEIAGYWQQDYLWASQMRSLPLSSLPPFDIILTYQNEYGSLAYTRIFGVTIQDDGSTMSIDQTVGETVAQYVALEIDRTTPIFEQGRTAIFHDTLFYGRYDLNNLRLEGGYLVSEVLGRVRKLRAAKAWLVSHMAGASSSEAQLIEEKIRKIDNAVNYLLDALGKLDEYDDIDVSQAIQSDPYLSRVIDTGVEVFHDDGFLIDFLGYQPAEPMLGENQYNVSGYKVSSDVQKVLTKEPEKQFLGYDRETMEPVFEENESNVEEYNPLPEEDNIIRPDPPTAGEAMQNLLYRVHHSAIYDFLLDIDSIYNDPTYGGADGVRLWLGNQPDNIREMILDSYHEFERIWPYLMADQLTPDVIELRHYYNIIAEAMESK